jgi:hypothetical protein
MLLHNIYFTQVTIKMEKSLIRPSARHYLHGNPATLS